MGQWVVEYKEKPLSLPNSRVHWQSNQADEPFAIPTGHAIILIQVVDCS